MLIFIVAVYENYMLNVIYISKLHNQIALEKKNIYIYVTFFIQ